MDAYICIILYEKIQEINESGQKLEDLILNSSKSKNSKISGQVIIVENKFKYNTKFAHFFENPKNVKFLLDSMLYKLVKYLRNVGIDSIYVSEAVLFLFLFFY